MGDGDNRAKFAAVTSAARDLCHPVTADFLAQDHGAIVAFRERRSIGQELLPEEVRRKLSWQSGLLMFQNEKAPQSSLKSTVPRHRHTRIAIADPATANELITITVNTQDTKGFVRKPHDLPPQDVPLDHHGARRGH